jgi:ABC-type phosphate transport system auxiliary subunit
MLTEFALNVATESVWLRVDALSDRIEELEGEMDDETFHDLDDEERDRMVGERDQLVEERDQLYRALDELRAEEG